MPQPPTEQEIEKLLGQLKTGTVSEREQAAKTLGKFGIRKAHIVVGLRQARSVESSPAFIAAIDKALTTSKSVPNLNRDFAIGFLGALGFNLAMLIGLKSWENNQLCAIAAFVVNASALMIPLISTHRKMALGWLVAVAIFFIWVLLTELFVSVLCSAVNSFANSLWRSAR